MTDAGRRAFEVRAEARTGVYSFEQDEEAELPPEYEQRLRADAAAAHCSTRQAPVLPAHGSPLGDERQEGGDPRSGD